MKALFKQSAGRRALGAGLAVIIALLLPPAASAQTTSFTATGYVNAVLSPGIVCVNGLGQVLVRGIVHTARVQGTDARVTGQAFISGDGNYNADGTSYWQGPAYLQVGTWDAAGTNFTPTGGMWEATWSGVMQTNYDLQLSIAGYGSGGSIDGWRVAETLIRTNASAPTDTNAPYLYTGTIKPPPLNTNAVLNNFNGPLGCWDQYGSGRFFPTNQQLTAVGSFARTHTASFMDTFLDGGPCQNWTVPEGRTLEWRVDLVSLDENATNMATFLVGTVEYGKYMFGKSRDFVALGKWPTLNGGSSVLACDRVQIRNTNVILALVVTRASPNNVVRARVLDKADPNLVLYQCSFLDTPLADPTLNSNQFWALTGMKVVDVAPDVAEAPYTSFNVYLGLFQYTDGSQPAPKVVFDNLELWTSEVPGVGIERMVRLSWPASASLNYKVEGAPTPQGPWLPVQELALPGIQTQTVPLSGPAQFFRLVQLP
jgi:hypothetical protein